jgi:hypothetical protein
MTYWPRTGSGGVYVNTNIYDSGRCVANCICENDVCYLKAFQHP